MEVTWLLLFLRFKVGCTSLLLTLETFFLISSFSLLFFSLSAFTIFLSKIDPDERSWYGDNYEWINENIGRMLLLYCRKKILADNYYSNGQYLIIFYRGNSLKKKIMKSRWNFDSINELIVWGEVCSHLNATQLL